MNDRKKSDVLAALRDRAAALVLAVVSVVVRVPNLGWGLPEIEEEALPMKKAMEMWGWETGRMTLDPQTAGWPSFSFYVHLLVQKIQYGIGRLTGQFEGPYDFYVAYTMDPTEVALVARWVGILSAGVVVYVGARLAGRLVGPVGTWWVGLTLTLSPLLVSHSQMVTPDILLTMFAALAVAKVVDMARRGNPEDYILAGVFVGLGTAAKYTPILFTLSIYLVHLWRRRQDGRPLGLLGLDDRRLGYAALATVLAFCLASPYTFANLDILQRDFQYQVFHMREGHFGSEGGTAGFLFYLKRVLRPALGTPGLVLSLLGLAGAAIRLRGPWIAVLACVLPFYLAIASLQTHFDRYMLPIVLPLSLGLAGAWALIRDRLPSGPVRIAAAVVLIAATQFTLVQRVQTHHRLQAGLSTQQQAKQYIQATFPAATTTLAMEMYTPQLPLDEREQLRQSAVYGHLNDAQRQILLNRPFYRFQYLPLYSARVELSAFYYDLRHYLPYDFVLTSGSVRRRYERAAEKFPDQIQFYADLDRFTELHRTFSPDGQSRGPEIRIYRFGDEAKQRLLAERGPLTDGFYRDFADRLHGPHFFSFIDAVAAHAMFKDQYEVAELYYQVLLETQPADQVGYAQEQMAYVKLKLNKLDESEDLYRRWLANDARNPVALGNLAYVLEQTGRPDEAREFYRRCIQVAGDTEAGAWARGRLSLLPD